MSSSFSQTFSSCGCCRRGSSSSSNEFPLKTRPQSYSSGCSFWQCGSSRPSAPSKRWHFHQRRAAGKTFDSEYSKLAGCLFNPLFYFCLNLVITSAVLTRLGDALFGKAITNNGAVFVPLIIAGLLLTIVQTFLIYRYFSAPKKEPRTEFLKQPQSELLGDFCIFLNMTFFQIFWNMLTFAPLGPPESVIEFGGRLFFLSFIALLIYFPPRMFYLAEDIHRPRTWLTMPLANSPVILRVLVGTNGSAMGSW